MSTDIGPTPSRRSPAKGFTLIELLVGVAVGMVGILIVFQTFAVWGRHSQTTGSGSEAQISGTLAMFNLERDVKQAGYGFARAASSVMGCAVSAKANSVIFPMVPVRITTSASGPDTIDVFYGSSAHFVTAEEFTDSSVVSKKLKRRGGFRAGDLTVVASNNAASAASADCVLVEVTSVAAADGLTIEHRSGTYDSFYAGAGASAVFNIGSSAPAFATGGFAFNLGPRPQRNRWEVINGTLQRSDLIFGTPAFVVAENVADVKAEYGVDLDGDQQVSDAVPNEWSTTPPVDWSRLLALRVGILVRGQQYEREGEMPTFAASGPQRSFGPAFVMRNVDGTPSSYAASDAHPNNWRFYRYRVYERVIPMRNMIWGTL